jgi:peroxiredoxin
VAFLKEKVLAKAPAKAGAFSFLAKVKNSKFGLLNLNLGIFVDRSSNMKKTVFLSLLLAISASGFSQKQSQEKPLTIKVDGSVSKFSGKHIYMHHRIGEKNFTDSTKVAKDQFSFNVKTTEPTLFWISTQRENNPQSGANYFFFADATPMKAKLIGDSLPYSSIEGGRSQNEYIEYRTIINNLVAIQQKMQTDFNAAVQSNDVNAQNAIRNEYQNLNSQYINGLKTFIRTHPQSPVSAHIIGNELNNQAIPISELMETLELIDKNLASNSNIKAATKRVDDLKGTMVGYTASNFSQNTPEGKKVNLTDFRGKYVLIDFWASWCRPCRMENPNVVAAYNRYKDKNFTVLGVSMDSNKDLWVAAIKQDNLTWTHVSDLKGWGNEVGKIYGVTGIPQNYLLDKEGKIVAKDLRGPALDEKLAEIIK